MLTLMLLFDGLLSFVRTLEYSNLCYLYNTNIKTSAFSVIQSYVVNRVKEKEKRCDKIMSWSFGYSSFSYNAMPRSRA